MSRPQLPLVMPAVPDQRWDCHSCTRCCRELVGDLRDEDRRKIDAENWADRLGVAPYVSVGRKWALNKRDDGACVFLLDDGRCRLHAELGFDAKPFACRVYPFTLTESDGKWLTAWRFDCPSIARSRGRDITVHRKMLNKFRPELPRRVSAGDETVELTRRRPTARGEIDALLDRLNTWLGDDTRSFADRMAGAASLVDTLRAANLSAVREQRFAELIDMLMTDLPAAVDEQSKAPPTSRQQAMFRQLVFAHTEHLTLGEIRSRLTRTTRRFRQLRRSRQFRRGVDRVPPLPGSDAKTTFAEVDRVLPAVDDAGEIVSIAGRFVRTRLLSRYQFGERYYGWPVLDGLGALWMSVAVLGWLARYFAAARRAECVTTPDVVHGLALVDGAIGRSASLGTTGERLRLEFLAREEGIARLLGHWRLVDPMRGTGPTQPTESST
ncbi:MAG: YkgJ family cysteine cluster protein [Phycisphaerales bacterium]|nr:MAG: YkgJ family cysteine cluster protein [Phycisphaerales bacterium]